MKINAFCTSGIDDALRHCDSAVFCGVTARKDDRLSVFTTFDVGVSGNIYIPTLCDEDMLEGACDHLVSNAVSAVVRVDDLNEAGIVEARYRLSPVMLLHKLGVLDKCIIAGGVCLDNDDLELMAQERVPLVLTPTASAGYGYGFAPVCAAVNRGLRIGLGTFDGKYNADADIKKEAEFLRLTANAEMRCERALSEEALKNMMEFK